MNSEFKNNIQHKDKRAGKFLAYTIISFIIGMSGIPIDAPFITVLGFLFAFVFLLAAIFGGRSISDDIAYKTVSA